MRETLLKPLCFLTGALLAVMVIFNTTLAARTSSEVSTLMNQALSLFWVSLLLVSFRKNPSIRPRPGKTPWYLHFGGLIGIAIIYINLVAVPNAGTTVTMASSVLGLCLSGLFFDLTGFLGMEKRPVTKRKLLSLLVSLSGIVIMMAFSKEALRVRYMLLALLAGALNMLQLTHNSFISSKRGPFYSAFLNALGGTIGMLVISFLILPGKSFSALSALRGISPVLVLGGGTLGALITVLSNTLIQRLPGAVSSILLSSGQIIAGVLLDLLILGRFSSSLLVGSAVMILGLALDKNH